MLHSLSTVLATFFYTGYAPVAPGTAGSLAAVVLLWWLPELTLPAAGLAAMAVFFIGAWAGGRVAEHIGREDPGIVVIDEVAGMILTLAAIPKIWWVYGAGFILFRLLDIFKPWPCRQLERVPGGWGIMLDDVGAGVYACIILHTILLII